MMRCRLLLDLFLQLSLDEFMSSIDSESPSESDILEGPFVSDYNDAEAVIVRTSAKEKVNTDLGTSPVNAESDELVSLMPHSDLKSVSIPGGERLWEGALQLSVSSVISVIGILKRFVIKSMVLLVLANLAQYFVSSTSPNLGLHILNVFFNLISKTLKML